MESVGRGMVARWKVREEIRDGGEEIKLTYSQFCFSLCAFLRGLLCCCGLSQKATSSNSRSAGSERSISRQCEVLKPKGRRISPAQANSFKKGLSLICKVELLDSRGHSGGNYPPVRLIEFELIELGGVKEVVAVWNTIQTLLFLT